MLDAPPTTKESVSEQAGDASELAMVERPPLSQRDVGALRDLFKVLANDTRLRLLHALVREGELCVSDLCEAVGMKPQAVSNQLQRLAEQGIVEARRDGLQIFYRIVDPCVPELMDRGLCLLEDTKEGRQ